jgi:hypothetical protein
MSERYEPASDFLKAIIAEEVPLSDGPIGDASMQLLVAMTHDEDRSNRDWATMLLSQEEADTPEVRAALLAAANDEYDIVRAEALLGLSRRNAKLALPLVIEALCGEAASMPVFEAAAIIANPALVEYLRPWIEPSDNAFLDDCAREALAACEKGSPEA